VLFAEPKGTILPLGGMDSGHKGYGLTLLVEALTGGLAGHGRADPKEGWGATVFLQVMDPRAFAGLDASSGRPATSPRLPRLAPGARRHGRAHCRAKKASQLAASSSENRRGALPVRSCRR
jgi:LDH2 family malate/lactate/ureidoglycolate dehydrogenase